MLDQLILIYKLCEEMAKPLHFNDCFFFFEYEKKLYFGLSRYTKF